MQHTFILVMPDYTPICRQLTEDSVGVWITVFLVALCVIQIFGVRGYGEGVYQKSTFVIVEVLFSNHNLSRIRPVRH